VHRRPDFTVEAYTIVIYFSIVNSFSERKFISFLKDFRTAYQEAPLRAMIAAKGGDVLHFC
jgi:hypothetical protein